LMLTAASGSLLEHEIKWSDEPALSVVMAAKGYPGNYQKGTLIGGQLDYDDAADIKIFHAGTSLADGKLSAIGGRVLNVCARGKNVSQAQKLAYRALGDIDWGDGFWRKDIGWREIAREDG
jgi:phosphoribosylamine--glycine ligase